MGGLGPGRIAAGGNTQRKAPNLESRWRRPENPVRTRSFSSRTECYTRTDLGAALVGGHSSCRTVNLTVSILSRGVSRVILSEKWVEKSAAVMFLRPIPAIIDPITYIFTADLSLSDDLISRTK